MNLKTYLCHYDISASQKTIVIGATTSMAALEHDVSEVHIAKYPSMESLAQSTIGLCQTWLDK